TARDVTALRDAAARIAKDLDRLAADPDDPAANLAVGRHWCFDLNAWPAGLPKLARGSDPALKALAERDLAGPKAGAPLADLADAWWDVAARFPEGLTRSNVTAHAADLYRRAAPALAGMRLRLAEQRAGDGGAPKLSPTKPATPDKPTSPPTVATGARGGKAYDLLPLIDLAETGTPGRWERTPAGAIRTIPANKADRIEIPASLPDEYDLALVLERTEGENSIAVQMSAGDARFEIGVSGKQKRISVRANGENGKQFGTAIGELSFTNGKRQTLTYEVRRSGVRVLVDGAALAKIEGAKMTHWRMSDKEAPRTPRAPVIGNYDGSYLIHAVTLTDVSATFVLPTVAVAPPVLAAATVPTPATPVKPTTPPPAIPAADGRRAVDLLPLFDVNAGVVSGEWRKKDNALLFDGGKDARIQSAYKPPAEYDFVIEFTRVKGSGNIVQLCAREGVAFEWSIGASGGTTRLQNVNGHARNATQRKIPDGLADTDRHTSVVQVRATGVRVLLDGNEQLDFKTDYADLSRNGSWKLRDDAFLGLGGWEQPIVFHRVTVIEGAPK
ncbi:MAG TPA: hypothetical protein VK986_17595, partial [Tepidisphaeraceae bacterium]|nr:hypothetical protein [Tepidisphaeraceae bacterium]